MPAIFLALVSTESLRADCGSFCPFCPPPAAYASASPTTVCAGEGVLLIGGYKNCRWVPAGTVANPMSCVTSANPTEDSVFMVMAEDTFRPGCFVSASVFVRVLHSPAPVVTAPTVAAPGQAGLVASVPFHEGSVYEWSISNGTLTSGQGTHAMTFSAGLHPILVGGLEVGVQLQVIEYPISTCRSEKGAASVAIQGSPPPEPTPTPRPTLTPTPRTRVLDFRN